MFITFGTMKSRAVIKDVGRVLGFSPAETDSLAKLIPNQPNFSLTVKEAVKDVRPSERLTDSAVCLVADEKNFPALLKQFEGTHE